MMDDTRALQAMGPRNAVKPQIITQPLPLKQRFDEDVFWFGWHRTHDPRDFRGLLDNHVIRKIDLVLRDKSWHTGPRQDQGDTPKCVGFGTKGALDAAPDAEYTQAGKKLHPEGAKLTGDDIYKIAQDNDEWPGDNYDGSSGRGAMKGLQAAGIIGEYVQPRNMDELLAHLCNNGPVLLGSDFSESMCYPDSRGYVTDDGNYVGGHEYFASSYDKSSRRVGCPNSWGRTWSKNGIFYIHRDALENLIFNRGGEAWTFVKRG